MTVFLIGEHGHKTAFKITTARVVSSLDFIFDKVLGRFKSELLYRGEVNSLNTLACLTLREGNIYFCEMDDLTKTAKKLTEKLVKPFIEDYVSRNKEYFNEARKIRKINLDKYEEENK